MELQDFIATTLVNIKDGIRAANEKIVEREGKKLGVDESIMYQIDKASKGIKFDIAVTVSKEDRGEGGGKIRVAVLDIGGSKSEASKEEHVSRISFEVQAFRTVG